MAYQSFGSYGRFQQTPFPNRAKKILDEQTTRSQQQSAYQDQVKQQQESYLAVMRQKLLDERNNRIRNFDLENKNNRAYQQQLARNNKIQQTSLRQEASNQESIYKTLSEFSFTAAEQYNEIRKEKEQEEVDRIKAEAALYWDGLSDSEVNSAFAGLQADENALLAQRNLGEDQAQIIEDQTSPQEAAPFRKVTGSPYAELIYEQAKLARMSQSIASIMRQNPDRRFTIEDPYKKKKDGTPVTIEMTLAEAEKQGGVYLQQFNRQAIEHMADTFRERGISEVVIQKYFNKPAQDRLARQSAQIEAENAKEIKLNQQREADAITSKQLSTAIESDTPNDVYSFSSIVTSRPGAGKSPLIKRDETIAGLMNLVDNGSIENPEEARAWLDRQIIVIGEGNEVPLSSVKDSDPALSALYEKIDDKIKSNDQEDLSAAKLQVESEVDAIHEAIMSNDSRADPNERIAALKSLERYKSISPELYQHAVTRFNSYAPGTVDKLNKETAFVGLKEKAIDGDLTALEVQQNQSWMSKDQLAELNKYMLDTGAKPGEGYTRKDVESQVRKLFKKELGNLSTDKVDHHSIDWAVSTAGSYYMEKFEELTKDPNFTTEAAALQARKDTIDYVMAGVKDEKNPFYVVPSPEGKTNQAYFKNFSSNFTAGQRTNPEQTYREISADPSKLSTKVYLSGAYIDDVRNDVKNGRSVTYTNWVNQIAKQNNMEPYEVINQQIKAAGGTEEIKPGSYDLLMEQSVDNPRLRNLLMQPTQVRINTAVISTGNAPSVVRSGVQGEQDVMQLAELAQFPSAPLAAAIWALETGRGKTVHGPNALFNIKSIDGTGTTTNTKEYIDGQVVNTTATWANYESPLQSAQALTEWAMKMPGYNEAKTPRQLLAAMQAAGYATDPNYEQKVLSIYKNMGFNPDAPIIPHKGNQATNPNFMSPSLREVVYRTGDIMAGGAPSQHLDVKQVDDPNTAADETNAFFEEDALDNYIVIEDKDYGDVGPAQLRKMDDAARRGGARIPGTDFNSMRDGGTRVHSGWDYPTANNSNVYLKNGAKVVGGFATAWGYKRIIQLPDGRRFAFLHGYER